MTLTQICSRCNARGCLNDVGRFDSRRDVAAYRPQSLSSLAELQVVVSKVRLLGSASVSDKKSCPFSRLSEDNDSVCASIPDEAPCLPRRRVAPRARHQSHQYRYLDPCTQPGPFPPELFIILTHRRGRLCLPVTCDKTQRFVRRKHDD